jgi:hypothetical protein
VEINDLYDPFQFLQKNTKYISLCSDGGKKRKRMEKEGGDCISFVWIEREGDGRITFPSGTFFLSFFFPTTSLTVLKTFGISGDSTCYQSKSLGKKEEKKIPMKINFRLILCTNIISPF